MPRRLDALLLPVLLLLPTLTPPRGGWATVTVDDLPDFAVAGSPLPLRFVIRQHGVTPLPGMHPTVEARSGAKSAQAEAVAGPASGQYEARLTLPEPGNWTITIRSGFGDSKLTLLPLPITAAGAPAPAPLADEERGRRLFVSKGCIGCHTRGDVDVGGGAMIGPVLTGKRWAREFLLRFLADPAANATHTGSFRMPNLGLKLAEIGYLATFLNAGR